VCRQFNNPPIAISRPKSRGDHGQPHDRLAIGQAGQAVAGAGVLQVEEAEHRGEQSQSDQQYGHGFIDAGGAGRPLISAEKGLETRSHGHLT
jgi:hypothetical protein